MTPGTTQTPLGRRPAALAAFCLLAWGPAGCGPGNVRLDATDRERIAPEVEAALWAFHAADTARDAEAVVALLWPEYTMLADGVRTDYEAASAGSRAFMATLDLFHTDWTDVQVLPLGPSTAITSFVFRDSLVSATGARTRSRGPTTFLWEKRGGEWRVLFGDADHYPIQDRWDEAEVRSVLGAFPDAWNARDAASWVAHFADSSGFTNILGMHFADRAANQARHAQLFSSIFRTSHLSAEVLDVRWVGREAAVAEVAFELVGYDRLPPGIEETIPGALQTRLIVVLERREGAWVVVEAQNTALVPAAVADTRR